MKIPWRRDRLPTPVFLGFPCGSAGKESTCTAGDECLIPGSGRSPGERNGNPFQYFCLEDPMDRGAWQDTVHGVASIKHDLATEPSPFPSTPPQVHLLVSLWWLSSSWYDSLNIPKCILSQGPCLSMRSVWGTVPFTWIKSAFISFWTELKCPSPSEICSFRLPKFQPISLQNFCFLSLIQSP